MKRNEVTWFSIISVMVFILLAISLVEVPVEGQFIEDSYIEESTPINPNPYITKPYSSGPAVNTPKEEITEEVIESSWDGPVLNSYIGTVTGPSGKETYYNLDMSEIVGSIQEKGWLWNDIADEYKENVSGDYWIREDGCKMLGDYIMVAANLSVHPRGSLVETSLGIGVVVDTGSFAENNPYQLDIAVNW